MSLLSVFARRRRSPLARLAPVDPADQIRFFTRPPAPFPSHVPTAPLDVPDSLVVGEETRGDDSACYRLTAVTRPGLPHLQPGAYWVTYGRLGGHGRGGTPRPGPLDTAAATLEDLNTAITRDAARHLPGAGVVEVLTDLAVMGGQVYAAGRVAGTFTLHLLKPAEPTTPKADSPVQEAAATTAGEAADPAESLRWTDLLGVAPELLEGRTVEEVLGRPPAGPASSPGDGETR